MTDDDNEKAQNDFARIEPASISLTAKASPAAAGKRPGLRHSPLLWLGLGVLLSSVIVVVFLLPGWVSQPGTESPAPEAPPAQAAATTTRTPAKEKVSPWEKAQESQLRKETQEILSQMLEAQKELADRGVEQWAGEAYAEAMSYAATGDERYNDRDFENSKIEYEKAMVIFSRLVKEMDDTFQAAIDRGNKALADGNSAAARQAFDLALTIDGIDRTALLGRERADKLDELMALMDQADDLLEKGLLDEARKIYQQAASLDEHYDQAKKQIEVTDERILDREFNRHMSDGFADMEKQRFSKAQAAFGRALKLKPRSAEARFALEQTQHKLTTLNINSLLAAARELEQEERWHDALQKYEAALKLDSSLAEAQQGRKQSTLRSQVHERLEKILSAPQRLYDAKVYDETVQFENSLRKLSAPGPILRKQLDKLAALLDRANTPVQVSLQSDNQTVVSLRRVGELGRFAEKTLSIKPGKYVAVGIREGYRDVRVEFMVDPDKPPTTVMVKAEERIALGN